MSWRGSERRSAARRWEDEPWTRGEQREFERQLGERIGNLTQELTNARQQLSRVLGAVALAAVAAPVLVTLVLVLSGQA